jgi:prephenate dehydrogenase
VLDRYEMDIARAVSGADMVVLAVPLGAMASTLSKMREHIGPGCVLTDVGSAKACVINDVEQVFGGRPPGFVPGHPIAGTEKSGVEASFPTLFRDRRVILTPLPESASWAHALVKAMWEATGAQVVEMDVAHHDEMLAATSHLPHVLAYVLVETLATLDERAEVFRFAAGGFRDFTRLATSDPLRWRDICVANREPLLAIIGRFERDLRRLSDAIRDANDGEVLETFQRAKKARDDLYRE